MGIFNRHNGGAAALPPRAAALPPIVVPQTVNNTYIGATAPQPAQPATGDDTCPPTSAAAASAPDRLDPRMIAGRTVEDGHNGRRRYSVLVCVLGVLAAAGFVFGVCQWHSGSPTITNEQTFDSGHDVIVGGSSGLPDSVTDVLPNNKSGAGVGSKDALNINDLAKQAFKK